MAAVKRLLALGAPEEQLVEQLVTQMVVSRRRGWQLLWRWSRHLSGWAYGLLWRASAAL
jgi:hypothetical protein